MTRLASKSSSWRQAISLGFALALSLSMPAHAETWIKAESANFVVYSNNNEKSTRDFVSRLEAFRKIATDFYNRLSQSQVTDDNKVVYVYKSFDDLNSEAGYSFSFSPSQNCRDGRFATWSDNEAVAESGFQEFQFSSLNSRIANAYDTADMPKWLSKGLYLYLLTAQIKDGKVILGAPPMYAITHTSTHNNDEADTLRSKSLRVPFSEIISGAYSDPKKTAPIAGESWLVVHYLLTDSANTAKFYDYIGHYNTGEDSTKAWQETIKVDPAVLDGVLDSYLNKGVPEVTYTFVPMPTDAVTVTPFAKSEQMVPELSVAVQSCPAAADRRSLLAELDLAAKRAPDDAYVLREQARGQVLLGDPAQAIPYLSQLVQTAPQDFDSHYLLGRAWLAGAQASKDGDTAADYAQARGELGKAYALNTTYAPAVYYYAKSFADRPDYPDDNTITAAQTAFDLTGAWDYRVYLAELQARRGKFDDMENTLDAADLSGDGTTNYDIVTKRIFDAVAQNQPVGGVVALFSEYDDAPWDKARKK